jgi:hypothetical protein
MSGGSGKGAQKRKWLAGHKRRWAAALFGLLAIGLVVLFPGQRLGMAFTLGTGLGRATLQRRIDGLEQRAITSPHALFDADDREFLTDFYRTLATGARLSLVLGQSGKLLHHYLDSSGTDYELEPRIFRDNDRVQAQLAVLGARAKRAGCVIGQHFVSDSFHMPDRSNIDSVFGLYYGTLAVTVLGSGSGAAGCKLHVHAEVPWRWPSYAELAVRHGTPYSERFPLPNLQSFIRGPGHELLVGNGLGGKLAELGLARPFLAYAEWDAF